MNRLRVPLDATRSSTATVASGRMMLMRLLMVVISAQAPDSLIIHTLRVYCTHDPRFRGRPLGHDTSARSVRGGEAPARAGSHRRHPRYRVPAPAPVLQTDREIPRRD